MTRTLGLLGLAVALIGLSTGLSGQARPTTSPAPGAGDWPQYANDVRGTKYSPLDQINASNFNSLEVAWRFKTDIPARARRSFEGTPIVVNGVLPQPAARGAGRRARREDRRADGRTACARGGAPGLTAPVIRPHSRIDRRARRRSRDVTTATGCLAERAHRRSSPRSPTRAFST
jgi:hypothetical protein